MKKKISIKELILILIPILMMIIPIIIEMNFERTTVETEAIITDIRYYYDNRNIKWYIVAIKYDVDGKWYTGSFECSNKEFPKDGTEIIRYNLKNPKEYITDTQMDRVDFKFFMCFFGYIFFLASLIIVVEMKNDNSEFANYSNSFERKIKMQEKEIKTYLPSFSLVLLITGVICFVEHTNPHTITKLIHLLSLTSFWFAAIGVVVLLIILYFYLKIKHDEIYPILLSGNDDIKHFNKYVDIYFVNDCIVDITTFFKKVYYKNIVIADVKKWNGNEFIHIILFDKNFRKRTIANTHFITSKEHLEILKEIEKRIPNVLIGYNKKNKKIIKNRNKGLLTDEIKNKSVIKNECQYQTEFLDLEQKDFMIKIKNVLDKHCHKSDISSIDSNATYKIHFEKILYKSNVKNSLLEFIKKENTDEEYLNFLENSIQRKNDWEKDLKKLFEEWKVNNEYSDKIIAKFKENNAEIYQLGEDNYSLLYDEILYGDSDICRLIYINGELYLLVFYFVS